MKRMINTLGIVLLCTWVFFPFCKSEPVEIADLILQGGKVVTVDQDFTIQEAVAVKGNRIIYVGSNSGVKALTGDRTRVIQLNGSLVLPGLIDAHAHMNSLGIELVSFNINHTTSLAQIVEKAAEKVKKTTPGEWIIGGRWDHTRWRNKKFPLHDDLSRVTPDNPVYLSRVDGNSAFVNKKAMDIAGINKNTPDPDGGKIIRKPDGHPTGVLINRAMNLVKKHFPRELDADWKRKILLAVDDSVKKGLTGWHEAGSSPREIGLFKELIDQKKLKMRVYAMLGEQEVPILKGNLKAYFKKHRILNYGEHFLSVRSVKLFFDGALGSRGAAFFTEYLDDRGNRGLLRIEPDYIYKVCKAALETGMGVNTHCIGIRGNRLCLDAYEKALKEVPVRDHRFRIEHAQVVRDEEIQKFKDLKVIPSMQPTHCTSDMTFIEARIGESRARKSYAWRSFIKAGLLIPCGSDFPVESNNPFWGIYAAVTRQDHQGNPPAGWNSQERMTVREAVKGFTIWAAYAAFWEDVMGSIEVGKLADFTVIDRDIFKIKPREILSTRVLYTIVNGAFVYQRDSKEL